MVVLNAHERSLLDSVATRNTCSGCKSGDNIRCNSKCVHSYCCYCFVNECPSCGESVDHSIAEKNLKHLEAFMENITSSLKKFVDQSNDNENVDENIENGIDDIEESSQAMVADTEVDVAPFSEMRHPKRIVEDSYNHLLDSDSSHEGYNFNNIGVSATTTSSRNVIPDTFDERAYDRAQLDIAHEETTTTTSNSELLPMEGTEQEIVTNVLGMDQEIRGNFDVVNQTFLGKRRTTEDQLSLETEDAEEPVASNNNCTTA